MTLIAAWVDWTEDNRPRIICQADTRISNTATSVAISDNATKVFRIDARVSRLNDFDVLNGRAGDPIDGAGMGLFYAGDVILMSLIANVIQQTLSNLCQIDDTEGEVDLRWIDISKHIELVTATILAQYKPIKALPTDILFFFCREWLSDDPYPDRQK